jgi:hypothetical protein
MVVQVNERSPVIASTANLFTFPTTPFTSNYKRVYPGRAPALLLSRLLEASQWRSVPFRSDGFPDGDPATAAAAATTVYLE